MKKYILLNIAFFFSFMFLASAQVSPLVISEVFYDSPLNENCFKDKNLGDYTTKIPANNGEFIEIFNPTASRIYLNGYYIVVEGRNKVLKNFFFPQGTYIEARSTCLIAYRDKRSPQFSLREVFPNITLEQEKSSIFYHNGFRLNNTAGRVKIFNKETLLDEVSYSFSANSNKVNEEYWNLKARNGEIPSSTNSNYYNCVSLQRKSIHHGITKIYPLAEDYETRMVTPLSIKDETLLPLIGELFDSNSIDTKLAVGSLPGEASVSLTGAAIYQIPLNIPKGVNGLQPPLSIVYNSQSGSGLLGKGWDLSGISSIERGTQSLYFDQKDGKISSKIVEFSDTKDQLYLDGQRLILLEGTHMANNSIYATEVEDYSRVKISKSLSKGRYFVKTTKEGNSFEYGRTDDSRQAMVKSTPLSDKSNFVLSCKLNKIKDKYGNSIEYSYINNGKHIKKITYVGTDDYIEFHYIENTHNPKNIYLKNFNILHNRILSSINIYSEGQLLRKYGFTYDYSSIDIRLEAITEYVGKNAEHKLNSTKIEWGKESKLEVPKGIGSSGNNIDNDVRPMLYTGDLDGDGYTDIIEFTAGNKKNNPGGRIQAYRFLNNEKRFDTTPYLDISFGGDTENLPEKKMTVGDIDNDGKDDVLLFHDGFLLSYRNIVYNTYNHKSYDLRSIGVKFINERKINYIIYDFNNDGVNDVVLMVNRYENYPGQAVCFEGVRNGDLKYKGVYSFPSSSGSFQVGNFNGDGKLDFTFIWGTLANWKEAEVDRSNEWFNWGIEYMTLSKANLLARSYIASDFNADGLTDVLQEKFISQRQSSILLRKNKGNFHSSEDIDLGIYFSFTEKFGFRMLPLDYNGDGLTDIIFLKENYRYVSVSSSKKEWQLSNTEWHFYTNKGNNKFSKASIPGFANGMPKSNYVFMDVNGDGIQDLVWSKGGSYYYISMPDANKKDLVHKITNGLGQKNEFTYTNYTDYNQQNPSPPLYNLKAPVTVVQNHTDIAGNVTKYLFQDGVYHRNKGFIGYKKVIAENIITGIKNVNEYNVDNTFYNLYLTKSTTSLYNEIINTSDYSSRTTGVNYGKNGEKRFMPLIYNQKIKDHIKNINTETSTNHNNDGTVNWVYENTGNGLQTSRITYSDYKLRDANGIVKYLPQTVTIELTRRGERTISDKTTYIYNDKGDIVKMVENAQTNNNKTITEYAYYSQGPINIKVLTYSNGTSEWERYKYDETYRYLLEKKKPLSIINYDYDFYAGKLISSTDDNGFVTEFIYDVFGKLSKEIKPNGETISYNTSWVNSDNVLFKKQVQSNKISGRLTTYYDWLGREVKKEETGWNGKIKYSEISYDNKTGSIIKTIHPHFTSEVPSTTTFKYDKYRRLINEVNFDGENTLNTKYIYDKLTTKKILPNGMTSIKIEDATGLTTKIEDEGGFIYYYYNSVGDPVKINVNGVITEIEYDEVGNKTKLKDPISGTSHYSYYYIGKIKNEVNAKGDSTIYSYDNYGRLFYKTIYSGENRTLLRRTFYQYVDDGYGKGQIKYFQMYENGKMTHKKTYTYNNKHLIESEENKIGDETFTSYFTYDNLWRPLTEINPSGIEIRYKYNLYGDLTTINSTYLNSNNQTTTKSIWTATNKNSKNQIVSYKLGNGLTTNHSYKPNGLLTDIKTGTSMWPMLKQDLHYEYDSETYNLIERNDKKNNRHELYDYDDMDRLKTVSCDNKVTLSMEYTNFGNILKKTDVGHYTYSTPYIMSGVINYVQEEETGITDERQNITYTSFNKIEMVSQNNDSYRIQYGVNEQRIKTIYSILGEEKLTRYYLGNCELEKDSAGNHTWVNYFYAPSGLAAICKQGNENNMYYVHNDNMGSIQLITDENLNTISNYFYTPWGGRILLNGVNTITDRGYTGHEHLEPLGLINMNGRVYDPVLARFLSPDPYVQAPGFTQSYNRYAYCWNNPFKYTDPSGESIVAGIIAGAVMGMMINVAVQDKMGNLNNAGDYLLAAGIGALGGAAGGAIGGAIGGAVGLIGATPSGAIGAGVFSGTMSGLAGGFIGGAGNAWMNGASFGEGLALGFSGGVVSGITGGVVSGITTGIIGSVTKSFTQPQKSSLYYSTDLAYVYAVDVNTGNIQMISDIGGPNFNIYGVGVWSDAGTAFQAYSQIIVDGSNTINSFRFWQSALSTISVVSIPSASLTGYFLEPKGPSTIESNKNQRIPAGQYSLEPAPSGSSYPGHYRVYNDLVSFDRGITIHSGNTPAHTKGCLLPGSSWSTDFVGGSKPLLNQINSFIRNTGHENINLNIFDTFY